MVRVLNNIVNSPIKGKTKLTVTSNFGKRRFYNNVTKKYESGYHNGLDLTGGNEIVAINDGKGMFPIPFFVLLNEINWHGIIYVAMKVWMLFYTFLD